MAGRWMVILLACLWTALAAATASAGALRAYYREAPQCVVVLSGPAEAGIVPGNRIARALARQLSGRVTKVIHPAARRRLVREMAVDLGHPGDARHFAAAIRCPAFLRWRVLGAGQDNALVWSQKYLSLEAEMIRARDGALLWQSSASASRNSGDPPLSLFSLPMAVFRAAAFQGDDDAVASMLDDVARRMLASLPDLR
ncbi:MAG: hypothetical protein QF521_12270 [Alphaproteobacteria bacterium]|jgi:hypothetical protein|nr:hypothetical protein [Alphaproteobacteria bacterium]